MAFDELRSRTWLLIVIVTILNCCGDATAQTADDAVRSLVVRGKSFESLEVRWAGTGFLSSAFISVDANLDAPAGSNRVVVPDATFPTSGTWLCERDGRMRIESTQSAWSQQLRQVCEGRRILVQRHDVRKTWTTGCLSSGNDVLFIQDPAANVAQSLTLLPISLAFWPLDIRLGVVQVDQLRESVRRGIIGGAEHLIVSTSDAEIWVDATRGFLPVRYQATISGKPAFSIDVTYKEKDSLWLPASWTLTYLGEDGSLLRSETCTVDRVLINPVFESSQFDIIPERGTFVSNLQTGEDYMALGGEAKRIIRPGEFTGDNYEELMRDDNSLRRFWGIVVVSLLAIAIVVRIVWKRRRA